MSDLFYRLQRKINTGLMRKRFVGAGPGGTERITLVLYFDYEREFGNPAAKDSAEIGFRAITETLDRYGVRTTWNCVGLIGEHYPQTLHHLVASGQELASHTYHHVDVTRLRYRALQDELLHFRVCFADRFGVEVIGLHPPRDRWSMRLPHLLNSLGYRYLIARVNNSRQWHVHHLSAPLGGEILCIPSIADDWGYIDDHCDADAMLRFWIERIATLEPGCVAAIGFHPWVIGADPTRLSGFVALVERLIADDAIVLSTAREISDWYAR